MNSTNQAAGGEDEPAPLVPPGQAAEALFQGLLESAPDAIVIVGPDGRIRLLNREAERLFGYVRDELIGRSVETLLPLEARNRHVAARTQYTAAPRTRPMGAGLDLSARHKDGRIIPVEISLSRVETGQGTLIMSVIRDISERRRAEAERARLLASEQAARAAAERLAAERAAMLGRLADGVALIDPQGRVTFVNVAAQEMLGAPEPEAPLAQYLARRVAPSPEPGGESPLEPLWLSALLQGESVTDVLLELVRPDGANVALHVNASTVIAENGEPLGAVLMMHDVTAQRNLERQKDEFLASVSHDLRTPLAGIKASIGVVMANEPPGTPEPLHRMLVNIDLSADRMSRLVADLLELSRLQAGRATIHPDLLDLRELVLRATRAIEPLAEARSQRLEVDLPVEPVTAVADASHVERALLNLLTNAQKYSPDAGQIRVTLARQNGAALISVADEGPGIATAEQSRIFERFYRSESEATRYNQGSGLGLPIARAMVALHGGKLWVESAPGEGATFRIELPVDGPTSISEKVAGE